MARAMRLGPSAANPVRSASWPSTMLTPTALMNPTMTAFETKRMMKPRRNTPARSMIAPVTTASVKSARSGSSAVWTSGTSAMTTAIAPVPWTAMKAELVTRAPAAGPTR